MYSDCTELLVMKQIQGSFIQDKNLQLNTIVSLFLFQQSNGRKLFEPGDFCAIEINAEKKDKSDHPVLYCYNSSFSFHATINLFSVDLASCKEGYSVRAKTFSCNLTAFSLKGQSWTFVALKCVMLVQYEMDVWIQQSSFCSSGSTMAPQNSGNGPDGSHPPITRSPMAQERGMCMCVATIWCLALLGSGKENVVCQGEYKT